MLFGEFEGFFLADFELYASNKQSLPTFNSKRFLISKKLEGLANYIKDEYRDLQYDISSYSPSVWNHNKVSEQVLYFIRAEQEQKKLEPFIRKEVSFKGYIEDPEIYHNHIMFGSRVSQLGFYIYVSLDAKAVIDYSNLINKLEFEHLSSEFFDIIPKDANVFDKQFNIIPKDDLNQIIQNKQSFSVGYFIDKSDDLLGSGDFITYFKDCANKLQPFFKFIIWNSLNDFIEINKEVKEKVVEVKQAGIKIGDEVLIKDDFLFSGKRAFVTKISKSGKAEVDINGIQTKIDASKLSKI